MPMTKEKKSRICLIANTDNTWVWQDADIMEELGYKVQKVVVEGTFGPYRILRLLFKSFLPVFKSDIVFCWFAFPSGFVGVFLGKIFGKPVIVNAVGQEVANVPLINYGFKRHWRWLTRWALANADKVVAISMESANNVQNLVSRKIEVIYEGIDVNKFKPDSEKNERNMILTVGIINKLNIKRKGFETLIKCVPYVTKEFDNVDFVIVGKKKEGYPVLQALADELNVLDHVNFRGYLPDEELLKLYHQCTLVAFPSIHEGFPTVISEALACEKPVVSTKLSAIPEVVNDECGILMNDPFSPEELANAILTLLKDPSLRNKLGRRGREIIVEHF
ncbi:MAG TPA: glycosyltransferase family 4 protein, partial [Acidobacteriota bacterium]|nr:glycosyltransferase family 4 protein [Acidobacteriota bacterium]